MFHKGKSGNPKGRPKSVVARPKNLVPFREVKTEEMDKLALKSLVYHLKEKNENITKWYYDQVNGKAVQPFISDDRGAPDMNLANLLGMKPREFLELMKVVGKELAKK